MAESDRSARSALHFKLPPALHERVRACAALEGASVPEFARAALRTACASVERQQEPRERAARKGAQGSGR